MADPKSIANAQSLFGRLAVERGYISQAQLDSVLRLHQALGGTHPLGSMLVQRGVMTVAQVQEVIAYQRQLEARAMAQTAAAQAQPAAAAPGLSAPPPVRPAVTPAPAGAPIAAPRAAPAPMPAPAQPMGGVAARSVTPPPARVDPPPEPPRAPPVSASGPLLKPGSKSASRVAAMIEAAEARHASDLHLHSGEPPAMRIDGKLSLLEQETQAKADHERELLAILSDDQRQQFEAAGELDFPFVTPSGLRARSNIYRTNVGVDATFRILPRGPQALEELSLPRTLAKLVGYHQGLVLVTGPASAGKSSTLAALVNLLNEERSEHILLLEDPIEIVHPPKRALINQRQVGRDTESFARALRGALREDPDIIVIGDLRDRETISLAITAAETGHLVIGSMNTNNAARTVGRLIDAFPPVQQGQVRAMLSESLRGVVSQKLIPSVDGRRVPAIELLFNNAAIGNVIRKGELFQIRSQMQVGKSVGMRTFDESLRELVAAGKVDVEEARKHAENPAVLGGVAHPPPSAAQATPNPNTANAGSSLIPPRPGSSAPATSSRPNQPVQPGRPSGLLIPRPGSRS